MERTEPPGEALIRVEHLTVRFRPAAGPVTVVDDVSLWLAPGESFGLVGESGCGKTTVLRSVAGLVPDWQGRITLGGSVVPPGFRRSREQRRRCQMVFQDTYGSLHPRHTVDRILTEPLAIHRLGERDQRVARILDEVGLAASLRYRYPHQLSGGQRQRVAIARALILEPALVLLDEPTSALDVSVQAEILNLLQRLRRERGLAYLLVSHDLAVVAHLCDRLSVMAAGRVVESLDCDALCCGRGEHPVTRRLLQCS